MVRGVTLTDIARAVGLSPSTVSRILNHDLIDNYRPATRERVFEAARKMGYRRNEMARALRKGRTNKLGLMLPAGSYIFSNAYFVNLMCGVMDEINRHKFAMSMILKPGTERDPEYVEAVNNLAAGGEVDGLLLWAYSAAYRAQRPHDVPVVICGSPSPEEISHVDCDNVDGMRQATAHLVELGHRRVLFIGFSPSDSGKKRLEGYRRALRDAGLRYDPALVREGDYTREGGRKALAAALADGISFTAVIGANDQTALGARDELLQRGLRVPDDYSVVGFDDLPEAEACGMTTIRQPAYRIGQTAVQTLIGLIDEQQKIKKKPAPVKLDLPVELIVRKSTTAIPAH